MVSDKARIMGVSPVVKLYRLWADRYRVEPKARDCRSAWSRSLWETKFATPAAKIPQVFIHCTISHLFSPI